MAFDWTEVVVLWNGRVYHKVGDLLPDPVAGPDPEWFPGEDFAYPACGIKRSGRLAFRVYVDEDGIMPPCKRCWPKVN